jgi:hypothetical protein
MLPNKQLFILEDNSFTDQKYMQKIKLKIKIEIEN